MKYTDSHPAHDRESCSDLYAINVDPAGSHGCARCTALALDALQAALANARDSDLQAWKDVAFRLAEDRLQTGNYNWSPQELLRACLAAASSAQPLYTTPLTEQRVREIVREEIARSETERGDRIFPGVHK
jgi:hypothetical protein